MAGMAQQLATPGNASSLASRAPRHGRQASFRTPVKPLSCTPHQPRLVQTKAAIALADSRVSRRCHNASLTVCNAMKQGSVYFWGTQEPEYSVVKLQIGLFGDVSRFQRELNRLALDPASEDLSRLLRESCMFISSNYQYCAYACAQLEGVVDLDAAERVYNSFTLEERSRFKEETLVNIDGDVRTSAWPRNQSPLLTTPDQWMCATFVVALDGNLKLPRLDSITALRDSLLQLGSLTEDDVIALEVLWTPQATGDSYTRNELLADYPGLLTLL